jgi:hypothetical protein
MLTTQPIPLAGVIFLNSYNIKGKYMGDGKSSPL